VILRWRLSSPQDDGSRSLPRDDEVIGYVGPYISALVIHNPHTQHYRA
jgi:hypothetical protein